MLTASLLHQAKQNTSPSPYIKKYQQLMTQRTVGISDKLKNMNQRLVLNQCNASHVGSMRTPFRQCNPFQLVSPHPHTHVVPNVLVGTGASLQKRLKHTLSIR